MSKCPSRLELLTLIDAGESIPHIEECEDCREFVDAASEAVRTFHDPCELETAVAAEVDALLEEVALHRWTPSLFASRNLRHSVILRELLRRANEHYGSNPRRGLALTSTALTICDSMTNADAPAPELKFELLKTHSSLLRETGALQEALTVLGRAWSVAEETDARETYRAIISLCTAIVYTEPDLARFDEAIQLAESAAAVLEACGDRRRALIAHHTKAYALTVMNRFEPAVTILHGVIAEIGESSHAMRDAALAHALIAVDFLGTGAYGDALDHARIAEHLHSKCGDVVDSARAAHVAAMALAALGHFSDVRDDFTRTAEVVFAAGMFDVWCVLRLDYIAAALAANAAADVRADIEAVARVCMTVAITTRPSGDNSRQRRSTTFGGWRCATSLLRTS